MAAGSTPNARKDTMTNIIHFDPWTSGKQLTDRIKRFLDTPAEMKAMHKTESYWKKGFIGHGQGTNWTDYNSIEDALKALEEGRPDLVKQFSGKITEQIEIERTTRTPPEVCFSVVPECGIDIERYLAQEPEYGIDWRDTDSTTHGHKNIKLLIRCGQNCGTTAADMRKRGIAIAAAVDAAEAQNIRCEIIASFYSSAEHGAWCYWNTVTVKRCEDALDADKVAFWLACPDAFRFLIWCARVIQEVKGQVKHGVSASSRDPSADLIAEYIGENVVYIGGDEITTKQVLQLIAPPTP